MKLEKQFSQDKASCRSYFKGLRKSISDKAIKDKSIIDKLLNTAEYINAKTVLCYVSLNNEIATDDLINHSLSVNKRVAVPYCADNNGNMDFYYIDSIGDLYIQSFGIREPDINKCKKVESFSNSVIILPGLSFDEKGNRLGYGKGYYDRFLQKHKLLSVGLCYDDFVVDTLPTDEYDKKVDIIVTDKNVIRINGGKNG